MVDADVGGIGRERLIVRRIKEKEMFFHLFAEFGVEVGDEGDVFLVHGSQLHVEVLLNMGQFVL